MTYVFKCPRCSKMFEINIPMSEYDNLKGKQTCTECKDKPYLERVLTPPAMIGLCGGMYGIDGSGGWTN